MSELRLGVGICALNECAALPRLLNRLTSGRDSEDRADLVVVADGGSNDGTPDLAVRGGAELLATGRGRGVQLRAAGEALMAGGADVLLFLHADSIPRIGSLAALRQAFGDQIDAAAMRQVIDAEGRSYRLIERAANARSRRGMVYGDSGLAVKAELYAKAGGFAAIPLFEDVDLSKRIRRLKPIRLVESATLVISARRWKDEGLLRSSLRNWTLRGLYECGVPPTTLLRMYRPFAGTKKTSSSDSSLESTAPPARTQPTPPSP